ncbi:MAG TPA: hypothetical protein VGQ80_16720 [Acidimicrobiia bacterium]|jgi:hypothetical protein|nr:hypothetical protein [Acidimicrobiia bacterium]
MAMTDMRADEFERLLEPEVGPGPRPLDPGGRLSGRWTAGLTLAWLAIFSLGVALEPKPADGNAMPVLGAILETGLMVGWMVMAVGFVQRRRYGAFGSLGAAVVLVAMTIACPLSGHHAGIGAWWWFEVAGAMALVSASATALRST